MSAVHLAALDGKFCATPAVNPATVGDLSAVTCTRCAKGLDRLDAEETHAAWERRRWAEAAADCEAIGIAHLWEQVADADTPTDRMLCELIASVARYFVEVSHPTT